MTIIEVKDLCVKYRGLEVLSNLNFDVMAGDYLGIVGPNGSGKTTLVKSLLGLIPYEGEVNFQGHTLCAFTAIKHIGYLPQKMSFLDQRFPATAKEIVVSGVYCCKKFPKRITKCDLAAAQEIMELLGIADLQNRSIGRLSGGQQQRILLARALVHQPEILVMDEPTVALDPQSRDTFYAAVDKLNKEKGVTVLLISHDVVSVGQFTSKILYLDKEVIFYGTYEEFCGSEKMKGYFGASQHVICHRH